MKGDYWIPLGIAALIGLVIWGSIEDVHQWRAYAAEHHCREAGYITGSSNTGIAPVIGGKGGVAVVTTYTPGKTRYLCDDDVEIFR